MNNTQINGIRVFSFSSRDELIDYVEKEKKSLIAINAEKILHATEETRGLINKNIGYVDGIGAVWALNKKGFKNAIKIPGCELWLDIVNRFYKKKTFYLVGSKQEVINATIKKLKQQYQGIKIVGFRNGYIKSEIEKKKLIIDIATKKPDVVFVAMGSPKQELLMQEMQKVNPDAIYQGLGGSFDVYIGAVKRAPEFWVKNGLEWAFRWIKEPRIRTKRNLQLVVFLYKLYFNKFK